MLSPITKEISGFSVHFRPLPATRAFTLAKRVGALVLPVLKGIDLADLKAEVDLSSLIDSIVNVLASLSDEKAVQLIVDSLQGSTITAPGQPSVEVQDRAAVDMAFQGELEAMYLIVLESWKYNKLAPFKLAAHFGLQMTPTDTSGEAANTETKHGPKLALSGVSPQK
jgi:hypothetical protein